MTEGHDLSAFVPCGSFLSALAAGLSSACNTQCIPEGLESYYAEQDSNAREKFYTVINHYNLAKQSITRSVSPWMSVLSEEKLSEQETEAAEKSA
ncbi:Neuron-specific protein family member 1, partial [Eschrichtius robustus]|nr:Neuron-specific protein family member 1 [Eschrichtius robustus]